MMLNAAIWFPHAEALPSLPAWGQGEIPMFSDNEQAHLNIDQDK
jgi:hypothetical protein